MNHYIKRPLWQVRELRISGKAERIVRDLSHASVLVFFVTAVGVGILASISLPSELGLGATVSFLVVVILFPLLCGWLWKERWRAKKLEERLVNQQASSVLRKASAVTGDDSPIGLLIVTPDLKVRFANQTYLESTLQNPGEVIGQRIQDVFAAEGGEERAKALFSQSDPAASCSFDGLIRVGLSHERPAHITMTRIAPPQREGRILIVVEYLPHGCLPSNLPKDSYIC